MANVKISELPNATSLNSGDSFPVVQGGVTKQAARSVLFASPTFTGTTTAAILTATGDVTFDGGAFVFNESGADRDARFEGDTDANLLFLDASTDRVGIGTSSPGYKLDVSGTVRILNGSTAFIVDSLGAVQAPGGVYVNTTGTREAGFNSTGDDLRFRSGNADDRMVLDSSGNLGIGTNAPAAKLHITNTGATSGSLSLASPPAGSGGSYIIMGNADSGGAAGPSVILASNRTLQFGVGTSFTSNTGGTFSEQMRLDSFGNLGIGTSTPAAKLDVDGAAIVRGFLTTTDAIKLGANTLAPSTTDAFIYRPANNTLAFGTASTECMRLDSSGNLGLGGTPSAWNVVGVGRALELGGGAVFTNSSNTECSIAQNAYNNSGWKYKYTGVPAGLAANINGTHAWYAAPSGTANNAISFTEVMAIDASGNLSCGGVYTNTTGSAANVFVSNTGLLQRSTSSLKYKTDIQDAAHGLADVMRLRPVTYKSKTDGDRVFGGLIAEEVHSAGLTEFVQYADDGSPDALAYGNMVSLLTKAIQEQQAVINELRARVAALEAG